MDKIALIVSSPMMRALQTVTRSLKPALERGIEAIAWPELKSESAYPSSRGSSEEVLRETFEEPGIEWSLLYEGWEGLYTRTDEERWEKEKNIKKDLFELGGVVAKGGVWKGKTFEMCEGVGDVEILVMSHSGLLLGLLGAKSEF